MGSRRRGTEGPAQGALLLPPPRGAPSSEGFGAAFVGSRRLPSTEAPFPAPSAGLAGHAPLPKPACPPAPHPAPPGCIRRTVVLAEVIQAFSTPENAVRMDEARDNACNDMGKMLQFVLPVATQIQQEVIKAYGFSCDGEGGSPGVGSGREGCWIRGIPELSSPSSPHGGSHHLTDTIGPASPASTRIYS